ncbi:M24 family metallopeptidase, partial [bacterium AH-315-C07]|nr:M24 family metallopeptidase [bacterium AH-315-C07]
CLPCNDGDLILFDFGAEYSNYAADMSRTIPVNGTFTDRQKQIYQAVRNVQSEAISMMRPGTTLDQFNKEAAKVMESELKSIGLIDDNDIKNQDTKNPAYRKYFMHGTSHFLGMDVHDIGNRYNSMKPGMVLTCEPGIYIQEEGIGIRLENDVLVTDGDPLDLMGEIPIEIDEIESIMAGSKALA